MAKKQKSEPVNNENTDLDTDVSLSIGSEVDGFKVKQQISLPFLKMKDHVRYPLVITGEFKTGEPKLNKEGEPVLDEDGNAAKQADSFNAELLINGGKSRAAVHCIANAAMRSEIERNYPDQSYVGKAFLIKCIGKVEGKRYKAYEIVEIEVA